MNIIVVGCGSIGRTVVKGAMDIEAIERVYVYDKEHSYALDLFSKFSKAVFLKNWKDATDAQILMECASVEAVFSIVPPAIEQGLDVIVLSVCAFADEEFLKDMSTLAKKNGRYIYIPSGGLGGLDALGSAAFKGFKNVTLTTVKHPRSFKGSKYPEKKGVDPMKITERTFVFTGNAREAAKSFPQNANVAATLGLAGPRPEEIRVDIIIAVSYTHLTLPTKRIV